MAPRSPIACHAFNVTVQQGIGDAAAERAAVFLKNVSTAKCARDEQFVRECEGDGSCSVSGARSLRATRGVRAEPRDAGRERYPTPPGPRHNITRLVSSEHAAGR
jgi:hypothetical protein